MKVCITASAHITNSEMCSLKWVKALERERIASGADIIISHDSWKQPNLNLPKSWKVFDYNLQKKELGQKLFESFKQFHRNCSIKNFGLWYAYKNKYDVAIVIDSDCIVSPGFVKEHLKNLKTPGEGWDNPLNNLTGGFYSRGFPYNKRKMKKWLHMGLWSNATDLYGKDRLGKKLSQDLKDLKGAPEHVSSGAFFPVSGMNVSFVREAIPYMLFLPVFYFGKEKFNRHDDIWGGYILQKIAKIKNASFSYGLPSVFHDSTVDASADAREEVAMIKHENEFYDLIGKALGSKELKNTSSHKEIFSKVMSELKKSKTFKPLVSAMAYHTSAYSKILKK